MEKNVGGQDRTARWVIGSGLVINGLLRSGWARRVSMGIGFAMLKSAYTQECPVNHALGINSNKEQEAESALYPANA